jgi:hypothetical protein
MRNSKNLKLDLSINPENIWSLVESCTLKDQFFLSERPFVGTQDRKIRIYFKAEHAFIERWHDKLVVLMCYFSLALS